MTRRAGLAIAGLLILMLGLEVVGDARRRDAATYGQGGGESVCFCITETPTFQMVVSPTPSPTPTDGSTTTPPPTSTPALSATPTKVPVLPSQTPLFCRIPGAAEYEKLFVYVFTDKQQRGLDYQNIRFGPSTSYAVVGRLLIEDQKRSPIYWRYNGWNGINENCTAWVLNLMGEEYAAGTE